MRSRRALRGDCHTHSLWSDGGSPIIEMAHAARSLGHEYIVMTDHSPNLTVANGLSTERLMQQLEEIEGVNGQLAAEAVAGAPPFRVLSGIEVDINEDGTLDQTPDVLAALDIVVASVHSKLRSPGDVMTKRMLAAIEDPNMDILGHCTGRIVVGRGRPQSEFDHAAVFTRCRDNDVADRDQLPTGAQRPTAQLVEAGPRYRLPFLNRYRCTRAGSARVAVHRLRPRCRMWCHRRPRDQHQSGRDVVELERVAPLSLILPKH